MSPPLEAASQRVFAALGLAVALVLVSAASRPAERVEAPACAPPSRCAAQARALGPIRALWLGQHLDLETAGADALQIVPGIGPRLAARIVEDRDAHGPFGSLESVERVKGVGPALRGRMSAYVRVGPQAGEAPHQRSPRSPVSSSSRKREGARAMRPPRVADQLGRHR